MAAHCQQTGWKKKAGRFISCSQKRETSCFLVMWLWQTLKLMLWKPNDPLSINFIGMMLLWNCAKTCLKDISNNYQHTLEAHCYSIAIKAGDSFFTLWNSITTVHLIQKTKMTYWTLAQSLAVQLNSHTAASRVLWPLTRVRPTHLLSLCSYKHTHTKKICLF